MKKIVFIAPHLSTGGMPQYLVKQIESIKDDMDVYCIEWGDVTGGVLVVQRNRIKKLLGDKLITLGDNKQELFSILKKLSPDIVHLQEIPEYFMDSSIADRLYSTNRNYILIETSHDSGFNVENKNYFPDKFLMVSKFQKMHYDKLGIPCEVVEYPIESKVRTKTREQALLDLGLDPNLKHVINVGLFTPRKNQAEVIEYARMLKNYPIQFHFLGNHADNFKFYWEPLMQNFPPNCKWWNERDDVDAFYEAADLFLFTSRGHATDQETMPLVIRESLSWKTPSMIYNLPVYMGYFDQFDTIEYLKDDMQMNAYRIAEKLLRDNLTQPITITQPMQPKETIDYGFNSRWDLNEHMMYYSVQRTVDFPVTIAIKEYKSDAVLWASSMDNIPAHCEFWMLPVYRHVHKYESDPHFTGVKLCIYNKDTNEQLYEMPYFHKFSNIPTISLSNSIPYRLNYVEFFIDRRYDKWLSKKYDLVVDVGANVGVFTSYMLHNQFANRVVSVECDSNALKDLQRNFKRHPWVTVIPKALHHTNEPIILYQSEANPIISSTLAPEKLENHAAGVKGDQEHTVQTVTIKDLVDTYGTIDLLKIDIEGAEYGILLNTDDSVFATVNNLLIECHFFENDYLTKYYAVIDKLKKIGYTVEEFKEHQAETGKGFSECIFASKGHN